MTQTETSNAIVNAMLSWLKWLANWVLRLFNLTGGFSPLRFLADNWLKLLVALLIVGVTADLLIWLIRWRPHWVWFHKKRVIIRDRNFFDGENEFVEEDWEDDGEDDRDGRTMPRRNWRDEDFVVTGEANRRRERERERRRREAERAARLEAEAKSDVFTGGAFNIDAEQRSSDRYEDKVFRVNDLPNPEGELSSQPWEREDGSRENRRREDKQREDGQARRPRKAAAHGDGHRTRTTRARSARSAR